MPLDSQDWSKFPFLPKSLQNSITLAQDLVDLARQAFTDPMTGLLNKASLDIYTHEYDRTPNAQKAAAFVDLSGFKALNDRHGYKAGDSALNKVGVTLQGFGTGGDVKVFRRGGDEFVVLLDVRHSTRFLKWAGQTLSRVKMTVEETPVTLTCSVGFCKPDRLSALQDIIRRAELASKVAKQAGDRQPVVWSKALAPVVPDELRRKCPACLSTTSVLLSPAQKQKKRGLFDCPICRKTYPKEP